MDTNIDMVQGDASPSRILSFVREDNTIPDLTSAQAVNFLIYRPDTNAQTNTGHTACTILSPGTAGQVRYDWTTTDLPVAGVYRSLLRITDSAGKFETKVVTITVESNTL